MPTNEQLVAAVENYAKNAGSRTLSDYVDQFTDDATVTDPVGTEPHVGRDAISAFWQSALSANDAMTFEVDNIHPAGDHVAFNFTVRASVGGATMVLSGIEVFQVADDGRIAAMQAFWNEHDATLA